MASPKPKLGSIYKRGQTYWIKYSVKSQIFRESSHSKNAADAERLLRRRVGEIGLGKFSGIAHERVTMGELFDDLIDDYKINRRKTFAAPSVAAEAPSPSCLCAAPGERPQQQPTETLHCETNRGWSSPGYGEPGA